MLGLLRSDFEAKEKIDGKWNHCVDYWYTTPDGERIDQNSEKAEKAHWEAVRQARLDREQEHSEKTEATS